MNGASLIFILLKSKMVKLMILRDFSWKRMLTTMMNVIFKIQRPWGYRQLSWQKCWHCHDYLPVTVNELYLCSLQALLAGDKTHTLWFMMVDSTSFKGWVSNFSRLLNYTRGTRPSLLKAGLSSHLLFTIQILGIPAFKYSQMN